VRFTGVAAFAVSRERVWARLIDPTTLGPCTPVPVRRVGDDRYVATATIGTGFLATTLDVDLVVSDIVVGQSARLTGRGVAAGTAITAVAALDFEGAGTDNASSLAWALDITATGGFAGAALQLIGQRAPDAVAQLIECVRGQLEG